MYGSLLRNINKRVVFWCLYAHHLNMATCVKRLNFCSQCPSPKSSWVLRSETVRRTWAIKDGLTNALIKSRIASLVLFFTDVKHVSRFITKSISAAFWSWELPPSWGRHQLDREGPSPLISGYTTDKESLLLMDVMRLEKSGRFVKRAVAPWISEYMLLVGPTW